MARVHKNGLYNAKIIKAEYLKSDKDKDFVQVECQLLEHVDPSGIKIPVDVNTPVKTTLWLTEATLKAGVVLEQLAVLDPDDWLTAIEDGRLIGKTVPLWCSEHQSPKDGSLWDQWAISTPRTPKQQGKPATAADKIRLRAMCGLKPAQSAPPPTVVQDF